MRKTIFFTIIASLVLVAFGYYYFELRPIATVRLKTTIDPYIAIRGQQVALDYEISQIPFDLLQDARPEEVEAGWHNSSLYVTLTEKDGYWQPKAAYKNIPRKIDPVFIWGKCSSKIQKTFYMRYDISALTISEQTAKAIEKVKAQYKEEATQKNVPAQSLVQVDIEAAINWQGKTKVKAFIINDKYFSL